MGWHQPWGAAVGLKGLFAEVLLVGRAGAGAEVPLLGCRCPRRGAVPRPAALDCRSDVENRLPPSLAVISMSSG